MYLQVCVCVGECLRFSKLRMDLCVHVYRVAMWVDSGVMYVYNDRLNCCFGFTYIFIYVS